MKKSKKVIQSSLLDNEKPQKASTGSLVITKPTKQKLNKEQQEFNRLVKKIEHLRKQIKQTSKTLDDQISYYLQYIFPLENEERQMKAVVAKQLFEVGVKGKLLNKKDSAIIEKVVSDMLFDLTNEQMQSDPVLLKIFEEVNNMNYEKYLEYEFAQQREKLNDYFRETGFNVDLSDLRKDMTEEELAKKMAEFQDDMKRQSGQHEEKVKNRKKTTKQIEKEAKEQLMQEASQKNISTMYKQLAKLFHPDLETDEAKKAEKEVLMKELTTAYEQKDLHTLLKLELEWIHREEQQIETIASDKLAMYNRVLKEQVMELDNELLMVEAHPRYEPLEIYRQGFVSSLTMIRMPEIKLIIEKNIMEMKICNERLSNEHVKSELKTIIAEYKKVIRYQQSLDRFLNDFDY